jgi:hypothetical protein
VLHDYIAGRVEKSDVRKYIRFCTPVRWVSYSRELEAFLGTVGPKVPVHASVYRLPVFIEPGTPGIVP